MSGFLSAVGGVVGGTLASAGISAIESVLIRPSLRGFSVDSVMILPDCVVEEVGRDELRITDHPVEFGSVISDNAYLEPCEVILRYSWSNSNALTGIIGQLTGSAISGNFASFNENALTAIGESIFSEGYSQQVYRSLLELQASCKPFTIYTGKRAYSNMLLASIGQTTTAASEYSLTTVLRCRQVLIARTSAATIAAQSSQAQPQNTSPVAQTGAQQAAPVTNTSALSQVSTALGR